MLKRKILFFIFLSVVSEFSAHAQTAGAPQEARSAPELPASPDAASARPRATYVQPSEKTKLRSYFFDVAGPYPLLGSAFAAGINQAENTPPEWGQGAGAYGERFGSNFGIAAITTTARYGLAEVFREDTVYYRCDCSGFFPRLGHALISTVTARKGAEGRRVFSFPALASPYIGTTTAVYAWFPSRFGAEDAFRMGNYNLLGFAGGNVALEFIYGGPHTLMSHLRHHKK